MAYTPRHAAPARRRGSSPRPSVFQTAALVLLTVVLVFVEYKYATAAPAAPESLPPVIQTAKLRVGNSTAENIPFSSAVSEAESVPEPLVPTAAPAPLSDFSPYHLPETDPALFVKDLAIEVNGERLPEGASFSLPDPIDFGLGSDYTEVEGVITFRGNNFRDGGAYGLAGLSEYKFGESWSITTGSLSYQSTTWTGSGWVGQPLIVRWPRATKAVMNMYDWAREDDSLVEVIYATMDGHIYFLDLDSGRATRDKLNLGFSFKGAGALDPRGYPILYLGAGYDSVKGRSRVFVISLLDYEILHSFGPEDIGGFSLRGNLCYFDGSPLVDAETDQLIYPGENGILYIWKLHTRYDEAAGTISMEPTAVKWHYNGINTTSDKWWIGMEDSPVIWRGHLIISDNGGRLMCINLNTLELVWVQDILDDSNGSPVLSIEDGHPYIYISTSFHYGWRSWTTAPVPIFKIDAENGAVVWRTDYTCHTESGVSGGVQSTIALGKNQLEGLIYVTVAKTDHLNGGVLACINRKNGEVLWEHKSYYTWSSPVLVYNADGSGNVLYCNYNSRMFLLDALTGEVLDTFNIQGGAEASPAVFENTVVIGIRQCKIWGVKMK